MNLYVWKSFWILTYTMKSIHNRSVESDFLLSQTLCHYFRTWPTGGQTPELYTSRELKMAPQVKQLNGFAPYIHLSSGVIHLYLLSRHMTLYLRWCTISAIRANTCSDTCTHHIQCDETNHTIIRFAFALPPTKHPPPRVVVNPSLHVASKCQSVNEVHAFRWVHPVVFYPKLSTLYVLLQLLV